MSTALAPARPAPPRAPATAWVSLPRRRALITRLLLAAVLAVQTLLSLRLSNTAFQDEALYLLAGHLEIGHLFHGQPAPGGFDGYFSGAPVLYPVLAAAVDSVAGLAGARALSLLCALGTTVLVFAVSKRLFNERTALCAAALYAVTEPSLFLGRLATFDAPALFLLALAGWLVVRTGAARTHAVLWAAPVAVLAVAVKYAAALYLPTLVLLAVLTTRQRRPLPALLRGLLLAGALAVLLAAAAEAGGYLSGVRTTTTARAHGTESPWTLLRQSAEWGGLVFAAAVGGLVAHVRRARQGETPWLPAPTPGRLRRTLLGLLLCGTALLAPAYQAYLQTGISLHKHIGFGLVFAAPMAGLGLTRLMGAHFRHPQLGVALGVAVLVLGAEQADRSYGWPDSTAMVGTQAPYTTGGGDFLAEVHEVPAYYLRRTTSYSQWHSTYGITHTTPDGRTLTGDAGFTAAIRDGAFRVVLLSGDTTPATAELLTTALRQNPRYRLVAEVPFRETWSWGNYRIWVLT